MTQLTRRSALLAASMLALPGLGFSQVDRSAIRLLVGFTPGGVRTWLPVNSPRNCGPSWGPPFWSKT